jgi:DNA-binding PucR family transcriptional regulator
VACPRTREILRRILIDAVSGAQAEAGIALRPLRDYDRTHGGDLVRTLRIYLALGCNASKTAETLYLHRSGLLYRLRRIEDLLGLQLDSFEDRVALEIATLCGEADALSLDGAQGVTE